MLSEIVDELKNALDREPAPVNKEQKKARGEKRKRIKELELIARSWLNTKNI